MVAIEGFRGRRGIERMIPPALLEEADPILVQTAIDQWFRKAVGGDIVDNKLARLAHVSLDPIPFALRILGDNFKHCEIIGVAEPSQQIFLSDVPYHPISGRMSYSACRAIEKVAMELFSPEFPSPAFIFGIYLSTKEKDPMRIKGIFFLQYPNEPPTTWTIITGPEENVGFPPLGFPSIPTSWRQSVSTIRPSLREEVTAVVQSLS